MTQTVGDCVGDCVGADVVGHSVGYAVGDGEVGAHVGAHVGQDVVGYTVGDHDGDTVVGGHVGAGVGTSGVLVRIRQMPSTGAPWLTLHGILFGENPVSATSLFTIVNRQSDHTLNNCAGDATEVSFDSPRISS